MSEQALQQALRAALVEARQHLDNVGWSKTGGTNLRDRIDAALGDARPSAAAGPQDVGCPCCSRPERMQRMALVYECLSCGRSYGLNDTDIVKGEPAAVPPQEQP